MSLNPTQFPLQMTMFEPAGKLASMPQIDTVISGGSPSEVRHEKLSEARSTEYADKIRESETYVAGHRPGFQPMMDDSPTLASSIAQHGIKRPVRLSLENTFQGEPHSTYSAVSDGQHRVAVQSELNPSAEVPVVWDEFREPPDAVEAPRLWEEQLRHQPGLTEATSIVRGVRP